MTGGCPEVGLEFSFWGVRMLVCAFRFEASRRWCSYFWYRGVERLLLLLVVVLLRFLLLTFVVVLTSMEFSRSDLSEASRSGPLPEGPQNGPNRPGALRTPKSSRNDQVLNRKSNRIRPPPESENLAPRSGPLGTSDLDLPTGPLEELPRGLES